MEKGHRLIWFMAGMLCLFMAALCADGAGGEEVEKFLFTSIPEGGNKAHGESIAMTVTRTDQNFRYRTKNAASSGTEDVEILTDQSGRLISASRRRLLKSGEQRVEKIWRDDEKIYLERGPETERSARSFDIPPGRSVAVDGSLLMLLRSFPFDRSVTWSLFMVDFSGASIAVSLRQAGLESVAVPAGTFECYRMDVVVEIPLIRPRIVYWVTKKAPHFLVKSVGKRGPFTDSYETFLLSVE